jgi:transcriptional regulator with XRE-family HTH domain
VYIFDLVRQRREELGLSQKELAVKAGVSLYVVKRIETAKFYNPLGWKIHAVAKVLGYTIDYLHDNCVWPLKREG